MSAESKLAVLEADLPADDFEKIHSKSPVFYDVYTRKADLQQQTHYCPCCGHGIIHKLIAEAIQDLGLQDQTIFMVAPQPPQLPSSAPVLTRS